MRAKPRRPATDRMVEEFVASHGGVTECPPAYAAPTRQNHRYNPVDRKGLSNV
jgi:hypothetical protein